MVYFLWEILREQGNTYLYILLYRLVGGLAKCLFIGDYMKNVTREMIKIYKPNGICWLGYKLTNNNVNFHHLVKKEHGGERTIENGAILSETGHRYLHIIESKEIQIYLALNEILKIVNKQGYSPTEEQYRIINRLLLMFEEEHIKDKTSKNKALIKHQYLDREIRYLL